MVIKLHFGRVLRRRHLSWQDLLTFDGHDHVCSKGILSVLDNVVFSFCDLGGIMPKRSAVEKMADTSVSKKQHLQIVTDSLKSDCKVSLNAHHKESSCASSHTMSSVFEDSGIEVTPNGDRTLTRTIKMPGFVLNPPKAFPAPKFDSVPSERSDSLPSEALSQDYNASCKNTSRKINSVLEISENSQEKAEREVCKHEDNTKASVSLLPTISCSSEKISPARFEQQSSQKTSDENKTDILMAADTDAKSTGNRGSEIFTSTVKAKSKNSTSTVGSGLTQSYVQHGSKEGEKVKPVPMKKEPLAGKQRQPEKLTEEKKQESRNSKYRSEPASAPKEKKAQEAGTKGNVVHQEKQATHSQFKTRQRVSIHKHVHTKLDSLAKANHEKDSKKMLAMGDTKSDVRPDPKKSTTGKRTVLPAVLLDQVVKTVQENVRTISTQVLNASATKLSAPTSADPVPAKAKVTDAESHSTDPVHAKATDAESHSTDPVHAKAKVTDAESHSTDPVPAKATDAESHSTNPVHAKAKNADAESLSADPTDAESHSTDPMPAKAKKVDSESHAPDPASSTKCEENANNSCVSDKDVESSKDSSRDQVMQHVDIQIKEHETTPDDKSKPSSPKIFKRCTSNSMSLGTNDAGKDKNDSCSALADSSTSSDTVLEKNSNDDTKESSDNLSVLAESQRSEKTLQSVLPVECVETEKSSSCEIQKIKKKAKKKKKKSKRQRKSTEGDHESLLGVLPDYVPENDSRVNKKREDKVYNLEALFSGRLLNNRFAQPRSRPNYFFAIQITNTKIKAGFQEVQQGVEEACPKLKLAFVPVETAHLTLGVMHLPDDEAVSRAIAAMEGFRKSYQQQKQCEDQGPEGEQHQEQGQTTHTQHQQQNPTADKEQKKHQAEEKTASADSLKSLSEESLADIFADSLTMTTAHPLALEIKGLGTFRDDVVFAKVTEGAALDQITDMADRLRNHTLDQNISMDSKPFAPHITLMKMSKNPGKLKSAGIKKIDSQLYKEFSNTLFGSNTVTSIQLCSMLKPKTDKYYHIEHEIPMDSLL